MMIKNIFSQYGKICTLARKKNDFLFVYTSSIFSIYENLKKKMKLITEISINF